MSLMGTTKHQTSSHGAEARTSGRDIPSSDGNRDLPAAKSLGSPNSSASSRAPRRIKRPLDPKTPVTRATKCLKPMTTSREHRRSTMRVGRVPLGSTQGLGFMTPKNPKHREHHTPKTDGAGEGPTENDQAHQTCDSDEESFGGGDIFTSTDQQQLSALRSNVLRHDYDETTTEF